MRQSLSTRSSPTGRSPSPPGPDDESGQSLVFTVITDDNALFAAPLAISPFTGDLTYTPVDNLYGSAVITVTLTDNGGTDSSVPERYRVFLSVVIRNTSVP